MASPREPDAESLRLELQQALETFRNWVGQMGQAFGILTTGDALLLTYGFSQRLSAILFLASVLPLATLLLWIQVIPVCVSLAGLAMRIEKKLSLEESLALTISPGGLRGAASKIVNMSGMTYEEILSLSEESSRRRWLRGNIPTLLYATCAIQVALAILGLTVFGYKFM